MASSSSCSSAFTSSSWSPASPLPPVALLATPPPLCSSVGHCLPTSPLCSPHDAYPTPRSPPPLLKLPPHFAPPATTTNRRIEALRPDSRHQKVCFEVLEPMEPPPGAPAHRAVLILVVLLDSGRRHSPSISLSGELPCNSLHLQDPIHLPFISPRLISRFCAHSPAPMRSIRRGRRTSPPATAEALLVLREPTNSLATVPSFDFRPHPHPTATISLTSSPWPTRPCSSAPCSLPVLSLLLLNAFMDRVWIWASGPRIPN